MDAGVDLGILQILAALAVHIQRDWHTPGPLAADDPVWTTFDHGTDAIFRTLRHPAGVLDGVESDAAQRRGVRKPLSFRGRMGDGNRFPHAQRSEEHTSELQSLMRISYAVFCLKKKN